MRVERVVLEHHRDVALLRRLVSDVHVADVDVAHGDVLEPGDHPQQRRLAAAGGADEDDELAEPDVEADAVDGLDAVGVDLRDRVEADPAHDALLPAATAGTPRRRRDAPERYRQRVAVRQGELVAEGVDLVERERRRGVRVEHRRLADELRTLFEDGAHGELDGVLERPVEGGELGRVVGDRHGVERPSRRRGTAPRHSSRRGGPGRSPVLRTFP